MIKSLLTLFVLCGLTGLSFGQTVNFTITDNTASNTTGGGNSHNVGDDTDIEATLDGLTACETRTFSWTIVNGDFPTSTGPAAGLGPHNGSFNTAGTNNVALTVTNASFPVCDGAEAVGNTDVVISEDGTPVLLTRQSLVMKGSGAIVSWATASEFNNDYFVIARSNDGINFEEIGQVEGKGSTKITQNYSFEDKNPLAGVSYYQITQVDFDGKITELAPLTLKNFKNNLNVVKLTPNPVNEVAAMEFEAAERGSVQLNVFDLMGRKVIDKIVPVEKGINSVSLEMGDLSQGFYQVSLTDGINTAIEKVYKN